MKNRDKIKNLFLELKGNSRFIVAKMDYGGDPSHTDFESMVRALRRIEELLLEDGYALAGSTVNPEPKEGAQ
tara:strand:+ start:88 stop:303 length:216 start_codon:yes stop_codon:yes gene_type:complete